MTPALWSESLLVLRTTGLSIAAFGKSQWAIKFHWYKGEGVKTKPWIIYKGYLIPKHSLKFYWNSLFQSKYYKVIEIFKLPDFGTGFSRFSWTLFYFVPPFWLTLSEAICPTPLQCRKGKDFFSSPTVKFIDIKLTYNKRQINKRHMQINLTWVLFDMSHQKWRLKKWKLLNFFLLCLIKKWVIKERYDWTKVLWSNRNKLVCVGRFAKPVHWDSSLYPCAFRYKNIPLLWVKRVSNEGLMTCISGEGQRVIFLGFVTCLKDEE
jgi:hypothetical protein